MNSTLLNRLASQAPSEKINRMHSFAARLLPRALILLNVRARSWPIRYVLASLLVGVFFAIVVALQDNSRLEWFFVLLPAIYLTAVLSDLGCGIYSAGLSTALLYWLVLPAGAVAPPIRFIPALTIFLLSALGLAFLSNALRTAMDQASASERAKDLLLRELSHRTKNNLAIVISLLSLERQGTPDPGVRAALGRAIQRVVAIAQAHDHLRSNREDGEVEMRGYLNQLCLQVKSALSGLRPIRFELDVDEGVMQSSRAVAVGLIVNELATNAIKHAFPNGKAGTIRVVLRKYDPIELVVEDDGVGCPARRENSGSKLTQLLARQLGAEIAWENAAPGCRVRVTSGAPLT